MSYISKPERKPMLAGGNLRIYNILKDELKMDASNARELLAEMDNIINDHFQDIIQYAETIAEINERNINEGINRIERRTDQIDKTNKQNLELLEKRIESTVDKLNRIEKEVRNPFNPAFMHRLYWFLVAFGSGLIIFLVLLASR
ncbi:hypothetical protein HHL17_18055 [Chitinophaga sp. G-6-1-13]|uniref:Uncharacterized protein n=1 Tax=Chitinophaga fulva TaxID=2728842 RepID=A0A848GNC9_9BACT|nr:hypothetical protein [Chitinophaga fulva]NML39111.1 hypothetical protein [Chitinophaga fulva]